MPQEKAKKTKKETIKDKAAYQTSSRLYRSETNKMIAGVAGGLAEYFAIDPIFVRIAFVVLTLFHGSGVLIYSILWIILPTESNVQEHTTINGESVRTNLHEVRDHMRDLHRNMRLQEKSNPKMVFGAIIIIFGILFLLDNFGLSAWFDIGKLWPIILIILGLALVF